MFLMHRLLLLSAAMGMLLAPSRALMIELAGSKSFCLSDLEKDHTGPGFQVNFYSTSYSRDESVRVDVH